MLNKRWSGGLALWLLASWLLSGCAGFKPRGADSSSYAPLAAMQILIAADQAGGKRFQRLLERELRHAGAQLVTADGADVVTLQVTAVNVDKTVSAYSSVRQVREFNHYAELDFSARQRIVANLAVAVKPVTARLRAERVQVYDSRYVLGVSEEERVIEDELLAELARLLALRLAVFR